MKIIEAITDTNVGGAGILLLNRLKHTDLTKYDITVLLPKGSKLKSKLLPLGVKMIEIKGKGDKSFNLGSIFQYVKIIKKLAPDIINAHSSLAFRFAARACGVPVRICTRHCAYPVSKIYKIPLAKRILGAVGNCLSNQYIAVADAAKENLLDMGISKSKISVIINGAEGLYETNQAQKDALRDCLKIPRDATVLIICARLEECKGHKYLIYSLADELLKDKKIYLLILGSGSLEHELKAQADKLGILPRVRFLGFVWDISPYMNIADINVNSSVGTETSCLAISEGMSLGKPCVASDYGGNPYMVRDGENGLLYPAGDIKKQSLAIARLCDDKRLYKVLSNGAKRRFDEELNAENMAQKTYELYSKLYDELCANRRKRRVK